MATDSKEVKEKNVSIPESIREALEAVAKGVGIAITELWIILVRQYVVRGVTEAFTGVVLCVGSFFLWPVIGLWILVLLAIAMVFFYGAIQLLGNPRYYALDDIAGRIQEYKNNDEVTKNAVTWYNNRYK